MREKILIPISLLLLMCSLAGAQAQTIYNPEALDGLDLSRNLLETTEAEIGRHALGLVEPLEQLADRLMALNQFDEADGLLDRAIQITRFHNGLHTPAQLALIGTRIDNFSNRQAWDDAREKMDYLFTYYQRVPVALNENLIDDFLVLAEQHLRGATEDSEIEQGRHLSRVYQLNQAIISTARKLYGENSPLLAPYLYRQAQHLYLSQKGFDEGGRDRTNSNFYYTLKGNSFGWSRAEAERFFFEEGLMLLEQIRDIFDELDPSDPEGKAMSELYLADWHMLFDFAGQATESYEHVYASLLTSGASSEQVNAFFSEPRILPIQHFYASMEAALERSPLSIVDTQDNSDDTFTHQLSFDEWSASYPAARNPLNSFSRAEGDSNFALIEFKLAAENESTFLYKNRYKRTIGTASETELIRGFSGGETGDEEALGRLDQLRFRPKILNGRPAESLGLLRYEIANEI